MNKFFAFFEGYCNPYPFAFFRITFYLGIAIHFFPSIIYFNDNFSQDAFRVPNWNNYLYTLFPSIPEWIVILIAILTVVGILSGLLGFFPRISSFVTFLGTYIMASFNGLNLNTLALGCMWGVLSIWAILGGGNEVLSVEAGLGKSGVTGKRLCRAVIFIQLMIVVLFSGIEKLLAGWPMSNEMHILLSYPQGFIVRDWVAASSWSKLNFIGWILTFSTIALELFLPFTLMIQKTHFISLIIWQFFFLGIILLLEVPPLFYFIFAFGALLALPINKKNYWAP